MTGNMIFPEWLNANSTRSYPISETASKASVGGEIRLPDSLIVDAKFNAPAGYVTGKFFVSAVELLPDRASVTLSFHNGTTASVVAVVVATTAAHVRNSSYQFQGAGTHHAVLGSLSLGKIVDAIATAQGKFQFSVEATPFEVSVVYISRPMIEYVTLMEQGREVAKLERIVRLAAGENIRLTRVDATTIRIDAIPGENMDDCPDPNPDAPPIRTINGVPPDDSGNFRLAGSECIQVTSREAYALEIKDLCSSSCCGCEELSSLIDGLRGVESQSSDLREMVYRAFNEQSGMISTLTAYLRP